MIVQFWYWGHEELALGKTPFATETRESLFMQHIQICNLSVEVYISCAPNRIVDIVSRTIENCGSAPWRLASDDNAYWKRAYISLDRIGESVWPIDTLKIQAIHYRWSAAEILENDFDLSTNEWGPNGAAPETHSR